MSDDKSKRGPQDRSRINMNEDYEVRYCARSSESRRTGYAPPSTRSAFRRKPSKKN